MTLCGGRTLAQVSWRVLRETIPAYLNEDAAVEELALAFVPWAEATQINFKRTDEKSADVTVRWSDLTVSRRLLKISRAC